MKRLILSLILFYSFSGVFAQIKIYDMPEPTLSSEAAVFEGTVIKSAQNYSDSIRLYVNDLLDKEGRSLYAQ